VTHRALIALLLFALVAQSAAPIAAPKPKAKSARVTPFDGLTPLERQQAQRWMRGMSVRDLAAQLIIITSYGEAPSSRSAAYREFVHLVRDLKVGGMIVANRVVYGSVRNAEPYAMATFLNRMQKLARVPLLVGSDFERGASMRVSGTTKFPHQMAYGAAHDLRLTRFLGAQTAREARAIGVQWIFAPDADVNNNPDNPIINTRSFGENPQDVATQVKAFIEGAHSDPKARVLVSAKHFPGHGDTNVDSHMNLPVINVDRARMDQVELVPFRAAIEADADSIMTAHISVPAIEPQELPSTLSSAVLTKLLREDLKFNGLIVTDALDMQGVAKLFPGGEVGVRALEAGADVLLMPAHPDEVVRSIANAVQSGRISRLRLEQSVARILAAKARVGLQKNKLVNVEEISDELDSEEAAEKAQEAADKAVTLVRNNDSQIPLQEPANTCVYILAEGRSGQQGRKMIEEFQKRSRDLRYTLLDPLMPQTEIDASVQKMTGCKQNVVAAFITVGAYRGNVALAGNLPNLVSTLLGGTVPVTLISLGNPYLARSYPNVAAYMTTFSTTTTSETAAVMALFGEIPITGKLPVSIPGIANYGEGIMIPRR
jgi:beta-N-acetylhexosaminidase